MNKYGKDTICAETARSGNLRIVKWLIQRKKCPTNINICYSIIMIGNVQMVQYLHEHGCTWNESTS